MIILNIFLNRKYAMRSISFSLFSPTRLYMLLVKSFSAAMYILFYEMIFCFEAFRADGWDTKQILVKVTWFLNKAF